VASTDFQLASEVNTGAYKITATLGSTSSEVTVNVEHYALPKFSIEMETEKPYYLPGEHVRGDLEAGYFYGKPVAGGRSC
jgi:CD109 antigen